jgi:uncharacterized protein with FMN-binding domain
MKRAILIATGTVGGLGAVLAVTPPQFTSTQSSSMALPGADVATAAPSAAATTSTTPSAAASAKATKNATKPKSASPSATQSQTAAATPAPVKTTAAPATQSASGTFTGDSIDVRYGFVQVKITVENGKIIDAQAVKSPSGRNDRYTQMSVPVLRQRTLAAQSANISGVSGASFTSYGWYTSLVSALAKAGM